ncbi:MAG: hypothetical protein HY597_03630 [Candidatus Omnitrophica bacterium]|nr:hypothetical protein [Candidatus Omnitrophota bacterium]
MKKLTVVLMIGALTAAWAPAAQGACCASQPAQETSLSAPSCCATACPSHLQACDEEAAVRPQAVIAPQLRLTQPQAAPTPYVVFAVPATFTTLAPTFQPDDRRFPVAIYDLTKTYRL